MKCVCIAAILAGLGVQAIVIATHPARADSCGASIYRLKDFIASKGGLTSGIKYEDLGGRSPFSNASAILYVGLEHKPWERMGGSATNEQDRINKNLANSPKTLLPYAKEIINACPKVVTVSVSYHETGASFSLHEDKIIRENKCATPEMGVEPPWGYINCL